MNSPAEKNVVSKSIVVPLAAAEAFQVWTDLIHTWWPKTHSMSGDPQTRVCIEGQVGGRFFERASDDAEYEWGAVEVWDPPRRLAFTWYLGSSQELPTRVKVEFVPLAPRQTRVQVEHRGPELIGELWWQRVVLFQGGWEAVLEKYGGVIDNK